MMMLVGQYTCIILTYFLVLIPFCCHSFIYHHPKKKLIHSYNAPLHLITPHLGGDLTSSSDFRPIPYDEDTSKFVRDKKKLNRAMIFVNETLDNIDYSDNFSIQKPKSLFNILLRAENEKDIEEIYESIREDIEDISNDSIGLRTLKSFAISIFSFFIIFVGVFSISYLLFPGSFRMTNSIAGCQLTYCSYMSEPEYSESGGVVFHESDPPEAKRLVYISPRIKSSDIF